MSRIASGGGGLRVKLFTLATAVTLTGAAAIVPLGALADHSTAHTIQTLLTQIAALQAQLTALQAQEAGTPAASCNFTRSLFQGVSGDDVMCLQQYLNGAGGAQVAASGVGSPGNETKFYGGLTKAAVAKWQAANGVSPAAGYFGPISRAKYDSMVAAAPPAAPPAAPGAPPPPAAVGSGLTVSAAKQPDPQLAPENAARVPFTNVTFTASADGDVTVKGITVERQSVAADTSFLGVVLVDENGVQLGIAKTLNSDHQTILSEPFIVKAGTSRTLTIGGNMDAVLDEEAGEVPRLAVIAVDAGTTAVNGTFPIVGTAQTINSSLAIGSVTMLRGSYDPGASQTKEVGTKSYTFSSVRVTAGSAEKVYVKYVRWNQTGSAGTGDLKSLKTVVDGSKEYDVVATSDGKFYVTNFTDNDGKGILMDKGFSSDLSIRGDIEGGSLRTVDFDLAKRTDIGLTGQLYGYGIIPPQTGSSDPTDDTAAFSSVEDPWYDAAQVTINNGTIQISASTAVASQNIAINVSNQPLGAFTVDVKGEPISVAAMYWNAALGAEGSDDDINDITNIVIKDEDGKVIAGPVDGSATDSANTTGSADGSFTFSSAVTFPVGVKTYKLEGKIGTDIDNNVTVTASTTPTDWATVRGTVTGNTITPTPSSAITLNAMTVKTGSLAISVSSIPLAQSVIAGSKQFLFANYILDSTASGEDVRMTSIPLEYNFGATGAASNVSNCKLYDGATVLNTSDIDNPTARASGTSLTFDGSGFVVPKGQTKTIGLKCDLAAGSLGTYQWGLDGAQTTYTGASGITSGQTVVETMTDSIGQAMTAASGGTVSVALATDNPGYQLGSAGATNMELLRIKYSSENEDVDLRQVALQLSGTASNTPVNLVGRRVTLWDAVASKQIGEAVFATSDFATSSLIAAGDFRMTKDVGRTLIVKGDIAAITVNGPMTFSGDLLILDYDGGNVGLNGNYGVGVASGSNISPTGADTANTGTRIFKAYPRFAYIPLTSAERSLAAGTTADKTLYKFSVTAVGGDIALYKFTFLVSSSTAPAATPGVVGATTSLFSAYAYTSDISAGASGLADTTFSSDGLLNSGNCFGGMNSTTANKINGSSNPLEIYFEKVQTTCNSATTTYVIASGVTRYFRLAGTVATVEAVSGQESFTVQLEGDAAFQVAHISAIGAQSTNMGRRGQPSPVVAATAGDAPPGANTALTSLGVDNATNDDLIWAPVSTTTQNTIQDLDYTNGYLVPGLPTSNLTIETLTSPN